MTELPDWMVDAWIHESCACGHGRASHGGGEACRATKNVIDFKALPKALYSEEEGEGPFSWPVNWPHPDQCHRVDSPCGCPGFCQPEPPEPW